MQGILVRTLITGLGLAAAAWIVPGVQIGGPGTLILAALLMGVVNAVVRPIVVILPLTVLTFGLFLLVVNAAMFALVAALFDGFVVNGFWSALFGWLVVSVVGWLASTFIGPRGRYQILVVERRG